MGMKRMLETRMSSRDTSHGKETTYFSEKLMEKKINEKHARIAT